MKRFIFIENGRGNNADESFDMAKTMLKSNDIDKSLIENMENLIDFGFLPKEKIQSILFNPENIIVTWSMFSSASFDSLGQLKKYLVFAGSNDISNTVFIDTSGKLSKALNNIIRDADKRLLDILKGIERNYLITLDSNNHYEPSRINFSISDEYSLLKLTPIDLNELIK